MTWDFILPAGVALHMQRAVASHSDRAYLRGVHVEPIPDGGAFLVATNGIAMLIHRAAGAFAARAATIRLTECTYGDLCHDCGAPVRSDPGETSIYIAPEIAAGPIAAPCHYSAPTIPHGTAFHVVAELLDLPYPDWRRALSADAAGVGIDHLDPNYLAQICAYWTAQSLTTAARIHQRRPGTPWLITLSGQPDTLAVLMPRRERAPDQPALAAMLTHIGRRDLFGDQAGAA